MYFNAITHGVKASPLHRFLSGIVAVTVLFLSGMASRPALAETELNCDPVVAAQLCTPVYEWQDPDTSPQALVLCIHGFTAHGTSFDALARYMCAQGMIVYALDIRGFGKTYFEGSSRRVSYDTFADGDVLALARCIKAAHPGLKLFICGESMGGALALRLAATSPDLVDGLILGAPSLKLRRHFGFAAHCALRFLVHRGPIDISRQIVNFGFSNVSLGMRVAEDPLSRTKYSIAELIQCVRITHTTRSFIAKIPPRIPILVLQSDDDKTINPIIVDILRRRLKTNDFTVVTFCDKGHVLLELNPTPDYIKHPVITWLNAHLDTN